MPLNADTVIVDGWVLARNVGYDDWVRRAPAMEPSAMPPVRPTSTTIARSPPTRRPSVVRNRYATTRITRHSPPAAPAGQGGQPARNHRATTTAPHTTGFEPATPTLASTGPAEALSLNEGVERWFLSLSPTPAVASAATGAAMVPPCQGMVAVSRVRHQRRPPTSLRAAAQPRRPLPAPTSSTTNTLLLSLTPTKYPPLPTPPASTISNKHTSRCRRRHRGGSDRQPAGVIEGRST